VIDDISPQYEKQLQEAMVQAEKQILKIYQQAMVQVSMKAYNVNLQDKPFSLSLYPLLNKFIEGKVNSLYRDIYSQIVKSVTDAWNLSNQKNDEFVDKRFADKHKPVKGVRQILYDPNIKALEQFINRKDSGLNLSSRVWNSVQPFKKEMEQALGLGVAKGKSATALATELKKYLNEPDKLFRRAKGDDGKLRLSKAAQNYHPGQGVYRSSYQNSLRLTRTETNIAYRSSDYERWQNMPFVLGTEIRLSAQHKFKYSHGRLVCEICEKLKGKYPKDFRFSGWHPSCMCYQIPILMTEKEYDKYEDMLLGIKEFDISKLPQIKKPPSAFYDYLDKHGEQIAGWSNTPYWIKDNTKYIESSVSGLPDPEHIPNDNPQPVDPGNAEKVPAGFLTEH
jgi:hypothetical protein